MRGIEEIYERYFKDPYYYIYSLTKDKHLEKDIGSESFLKDIKSIDQFKGRCGIKYCIFQIECFDQCEIVGGIWKKLKPGLLVLICLMTLINY